MNGVTGIDYNQVRAIAEILGIPMGHTTLRNIQVIEDERLKMILEKAGK